MAQLVSREDRLEREGAWGAVEHAVRANGRMSAKEWLDSQGASKQASFDVSFRKIASVGNIANIEQFRKLDAAENIWEFKRGQDRILTFRHGNAWILTHHFAKKSPRCPRAEIERAIRIKHEHLNLYS